MSKIKLYLTGLVGLLLALSKMRKKNFISNLRFFRRARVTPVPHTDRWRDLRNPTRLSSTRCAKFSLKDGRRCWLGKEHTGTCSYEA